MKSRNGSDSEKKKFKMSGKIQALSASASLIDPTSYDFAALNHLMLNLILYEEIGSEKCDEWNEVNTIKFCER